MAAENLIRKNHEVVPCTCWELGCCRSKELEKTETIKEKSSEVWRRVALPTTSAGICVNKKVVLLTLKGKDSQAVIAQYLEILYRWNPKDEFNRRNPDEFLNI